MTNAYIITRNIVRAIFWGSVVVGSCLLVELVGRVVVLNLPW